MDGMLYGQLVEEIDACATPEELDEFTRRVLRSHAHDFTMLNLFERAGRRRLELATGMPAMRPVRRGFSGLRDPHG